MKYLIKKKVLLYGFVAVLIAFNAWPVSHTEQNNIPQISVKGAQTKNTPTPTPSTPAGDNQKKNSEQTPTNSANQPSSDTSQNNNSSSTIESSQPTPTPALPTPTRGEPTQQPQAPTVTPPTIQNDTDPFVQIIENNLIDDTLPIPNKPLIPPPADNPGNGSCGPQNPKYPHPDVCLY